ncbi:MAG TPA: alpha/beta fold hydrolase [Verrucomicrobiae bacterium]|nr:alpha/beta fold hydrolase [Verrucomicrobiae bacterium]
MRSKTLRLFCPLLLAAIAVSLAGCGSYIARRIAQAPNSYPDWIAPKARVELDFNSGFLTNFPVHYVKVGPPEARLRYRIVEPADYNVHVFTSNWIEDDEPQFTFTFTADIPGGSNLWTGNPRGTVILLHGYGVAQFAMAPWALRLAQEGWRCVLIDLRGHGKSTGKRIYFGLQETNDLSQLLDQLDHDGQLESPVDAVGESYGAVIALRAQATEPRLHTVVAINPYASLSNAIVNIRYDYAPWLPAVFVRAGIKKLPVLFGVSAADLDTSTAIARHPFPALFIAGAEDKVTPVAEVRKLRSLAAPGSEFIVVPRATHESLTYFFHDLAPPIGAWLANH